MTPGAILRAFVEAFNKADAQTLALLYSETAINHQVAKLPVEERTAIRDMFISEFASAKMVCIVENIKDELMLKFKEEMIRKKLADQILRRYLTRCCATITRPTRNAVSSICIIRYFQFAERIVKKAHLTVFV